MNINKITTEELNKELSKYSRRKGKYKELYEMIKQSNTPLRLSFDDILERDRVYYYLLNLKKLKKIRLVSINRIKNTIYVMKNEQ